LLRSKSLTPWYPVVSSAGVSRGWWAPVLLAVYGLAFGWRALGGGPLAFDDHPGQLYRVAHALTVGLAPWRWNPGWWAGYAELQFYPPGFAYVGAALHYLTLGALGPVAIYQVLLWVTLLLPGVATYALLARVLGRPWLALPGAFVALTLSAGSRSGIEEGLRWGLVAARLGWGLLPLLALALIPWIEGRARAPRVAAVLLAAIALIHPAHWPAAIVLVLLAARHTPDPGRCAATALLLAAGTGLAAFWLVPLLSSLSMALPLAWGDASLGALAGAIGQRPLLLALAGASALVSWRAWRPDPLPRVTRWLAGFAPAMAVVIVIDRAIAHPLGLLWLPADRLFDSFLLALVLHASLALALLERRWPRVSAPVLGLAAVALAIALSAGHRPEPSLTLWPRAGANEWPTYPELAARLRLEPLWEAIRNAPSGRVLFVRSGVPLDQAADWRRPHTHVTALAPIYSGREILNGTFTHPSPIAGLVYTGSSAPEPIRMLVEQRDGVTLFGRPLEHLNAREFEPLAERLRISMVVAHEEDEGRLGFLTDNPAFSPPEPIGPFRLFRSREPRPTPLPAGAQRWTLTLTRPSAGWAPAAVAWSPRWQAQHGGATLALRRDELGLLEVRAPGGLAALVTLMHRPGAWEWLGTLLSVASVIALLLPPWPRIER